MHTTITIIILLFITSGTTILFNQRFGRCLPFTFLYISFVLYFSQFIFHSFIPGYSIIYISAFSFIPLLFILKKDSYANTFSEYILTPGFWCTLSLFLFVFIIDFGRVFTQWDEFSHWGVMVKEMIRLDRWYSDSASRLLVHKDYPPFMSIFEMFWCHISGGFYEVVCYRAIHSFILGIITPYVIDSVNIQSRNKANSFVTFIKLFALNLMVFCILRFLDGSDSIETILTDTAVSALFILALSIIYLNKDHDVFDHILICMCCGAILLTKQIGITFVLLIWLYYILSVYIPGLKTSIIINSAKLSLLILFPVISNLIWKIYIGTQNISGQFGLSKISLSELKDVIIDEYSVSLKRQTFSRYIHALFEKNITLSTISISLFILSVFCIILIWFIHVNEKERFNRRSAIILTIIYSLGTIGYTITIGTLFLFCFSEDEMLSLHSYERYIASYSTVEVFFLFIIVFSLICNEERSAQLRKVFVSIICILFILCGPSLYILIPGIFDGKINESYINASAKLDRVIPEDKTVFILSDKAAMAQYYMNFYSNKTHTKLCYTNLLDESSVSDYHDYVIQNAFDCDYIYIDSMTRQFNEEFNYINNGYDFDLTRIYMINHENGDTQAEFVE